jgi:hypothetical protein
VFEQHELLPLHDSPSVAQPPFGLTHRLAVQTLPQHCVFEVQPPPAMVHVVDVEHLSVCGSQSSEQQSLACAHVAPGDLHWFGPLQRKTPSISWSQCAEQQSLFIAHV